MERSNYISFILKWKLERISTIEKIFNIKMKNLNWSKIEVIRVVVISMQ